MSAVVADALGFHGHGTGMCFVEACKQSYNFTIATA